MSAVPMNNMLTVYALPAKTRGRVPDAEPLRASISFHNGSMQITNNSHYPWRNVRVQFGSSQKRSLNSDSSRLVVPFHTCAIPLNSGILSGQAMCWGQCRFSVRWECRTGQSRNRWQGYQTQ